MEERLLAQLRELLNSNGWKWLQEQTDDLLDKKRDRLESIPDYQLDSEQGFIKGLRWSRKKVDEAVKELTKGKENATA